MSVWESHVTWGTPVQSFVFLGLLLFELEPMYATSDGRTDGRTDGRRTPITALCPLGGGIICPLGGGIICPLGGGIICPLGGGIICPLSGGIICPLSGGIIMIMYY